MKEFFEQIKLQEKEKQLQKEKKEENGEEEEDEGFMAEKKQSKPWRQFIHFLPILECLELTYV